MKNSPLRLLLLGFALSLTLASSVRAQEAPPPAAAPPPPPAPAASVTRANIDAPQLSGITVWAMLDWDGFGAGARYMFPLGIPSLLSHTPLKDSWALEAGLDFFRISDNYNYVGVNNNYHYDEILPTVGMMWIVWLRDDFAVYPKIDGGYAIGFGNSSDNCVGCDLGGIRVEGAAGLLYKLPGITLRAEVGNYGLKGGVAWLF